MSCVKANEAMTIVMAQVNAMRVLKSGWKIPPFVFYCHPNIKGVHVKVRPLILIGNSSFTVSPIALGGLSLERADNFQPGRPGYKIARHYAFQQWITK